MHKRKIEDIDFCVIDTETTGGNPLSNRVIDVAVFCYRDGEIVDKFHSLVNPRRPIPLWIQNLTGITNDMVRHAPVFKEIAEPLRKILDRGVFTAHNARFDFCFIQEEFRRIKQTFDVPQCCTLKLARQLYSDLPSRSLGMLCDYLMIDIVDRHRAAGDAEATVYVLKDLLRKAKETHDVKTWADLHGFLSLGNLELPRGLTYKVLAGLPTKPGSYLFKDQSGKIIHKGSTKDIQRRVKTFFQSTNQSDKSNRFREIVRSIEVANLN